VELVTSYVDRTASERSPRLVRVPNRRYHTVSPSELTQSVGHQRFSTVSPHCPQLPPLDLGGNITYPAVEETTFTEQPPSDYPSSSRSTSAVSGSDFWVSTQDSWSSRRSSVIAAPIFNDVASGSQSLRRFSLIVPETVWDHGRSLKAIKPKTLESVIQYLLVHSAGRLHPVSR